MFFKPSEPRLVTLSLYRRHFYFSPFQWTKNEHSMGNGETFTLFPMQHGHFSVIFLDPKSLKKKKIKVQDNENYTFIDIMTK